MAAPAAAPPVATSQPRRSPIGPVVASLRPVWSKPAAYRALRATLVIPSLFAITDLVIGNLQMATFAAFGGFATLVLASFSGTRRNKLFAHVGLGVVGSVLLVIGTAVTSNTALAVAVTVPVVFCVLYAGITGPNAASGATAALLAYVLPAASPGTMAMVPSRLAGWWLATAAGTLAVLLLSPPVGQDRLRLAAADCATALANELDAALAGRVDANGAEASMTAKRHLMAAFASTPYRPTGLARAGQALDNLVEALEWSTVLIHDMVVEGTDLTTSAPVDRELLRTAAGALDDVAALLRGGDTDLTLECFDSQQEASASRVAALREDGPCTEREVHVSFHARMVAAAVRSAANDALIATGRADPSDPPGHWSWLRTAGHLAGGYASLRSVWFLNSARGAVALAAAVAVADLVHVQHGFWVVLGTLSVLRTNAASTGATAVRALVGTAAGFFIGAAFILAIGQDTGALWVALPIAILVASYAPGTAPFAVGQAAFTLTVSVLYNILVPVGWKVGVLRVEDVAIGAAVSALVGLLFWPRGASSIVADDLADAFHQGGIYLVQGTAWAVGSRSARPDAGTRAANAGLRVDDALRGFLAEQGTKHIAKEHVWRLVGGALRIRLTAQSLSNLPPPQAVSGPSRLTLVEEATRLAGWCDGFAGDLGRSSPTAAQELASAIAEQPSPPGRLEGYLLWVQHHLDHIRDHLADLVEPVTAIHERRSLPWWR
jgi:uncharacterized membrane protein YccC